jgi:hypothetical protein
VEIITYIYIYKLKAMSRLIDFNGWLVEENEPSLKQFHEMSNEDKNAYIIKLIDKKPEERSNIQKHILRFYNLFPTEKQKNFFTLDNEG